MTLRTDYANETDSTDAHPGAHNETNVKVNELDTRVAAIDPGTGFDARLAAIEARFAAVDLAVGVPTLDRANIAQNNALASGRFTFGCFVPPVNMTCAKIRTYSGTTAAAATPTIVQLAIYREEPSQAVTALGQSLCNYTLLGQTANTPTLYATVNTAYEPALQTPVPLIGGQRYALRHRDGFRRGNAKRARFTFHTFGATGESAATAPRRSLSKRYDAARDDDRQPHLGQSDSVPGRAPMTLRTDYVNATLLEDLHPAAHNDTNARINALEARLPALEHARAHARRDRGARYRA